VLYLGSEASSEIVDGA